MAIFERIWLAVLTRDEDDAGSDGDLNLTVNIDGEDVLDTDYGSDLDGAEAMLFDPKVLDPPLDLGGLTHSSLRLGVRDDDAWAPQHVLVFGESLPDFSPGRTMALAMETDLTDWLSTDPSEGPLTMPLRLVGAGDSTTPIRRVLLLVDTAWSTSGGDTETDSPIQLEVTAGGNVVLRQEIADTTQSDLERGVTNWYVMDALVPFTRGEVLSGGGIRLSILGSDKWKPLRMWVFGLDTASGRPDQVVTLVASNVGQAWMSTDPDEGVAAVDLAVVSA